MNHWLGSAEESGQTTEAEQPKEAPIKAFVVFFHNVLGLFRYLVGRLRRVLCHDRREI